MESTKIHLTPELFAPAESSSFAGSFELPELKMGPDTYTFAEPLRWDVDITNTAGALLVTGTVRGIGTTECARCLDPFDLDVLGDVEGFFVIEEDARPEDMDEDEFEFLSEDHIIDLAPLLQAAILVDVPMMPLCRDDCRGICPDCGANLNVEECGCAQERARQAAEDEAASNPFAALAQLKFDEQ